MQCAALIDEVYVLAAVMVVRRVLIGERYIVLMDMGNGR
jgi:hypothetical protein